MDFETITFNAGGTVPQSVNKDGREYLVADLALIVPGVLNGSKGALYYPPREVAASTPEWDGLPIVAYHPTRNGEHISAKEDGVWEESGLGRLQDTEYRQGKLRAKGWFDVERVSNYDKNLPPDAKILPRLRQGKPIELSTGVFTQNVPVQNGVDHRGTSYTHEARNYRGDHLAVLPDQRGACSVRDGCGVNVVNLAGDVVLSLTTNADGSPIKGKDDGTSHGGKEGCTCPKKTAPGHQCDCQKMPNAMDKAAAAAHDGRTPPTGNTDPSTWFGGVLTANSSFGSPPPQEPPTMPLTPEQKAAIAKNLTANCACQDPPWKGRSEADLVAMSDDVLASYDFANNTAAEAKRAAAAAAVKPVVPPAVPTGNGGGGNDRPKQLTEEEWMAMAPASVQAAVRNAMSIEHQQRTQIVERLVANLQGDDRTTVVNYLKDKDLLELQTISLIAKGQPTGNGSSVQLSDQTQRFFGAIGGATLNVFSEEPPLDVPVQNWKRDKTA